MTSAAGAPDGSLAGASPATLVPAIDGGTVVGLHPLALRPDGDEHIAGRVDTGDFVALPAIGARAIELLGEGNSCDATRRLLRAEAGQDVDVVELVRSLTELGFVRTVDGRELAGGTPRRPHLPRVRPAHIGWLFSRQAFGVWAAVVAAGVVTAALSPELIPRARHYFWAPTGAAVVLGNALLGFLVLLTHELAHLFAARAHDLPARMSISTRLVFLVAQTDVSAAWSLPRRSRYRIYLAGMAWDTWVLAIALLAQAHLALPHAARSALQALALMLALGLLAQFSVYVRTDVYFVLLDLLRCRDLHNDALRYLRWLRRRLLSPFRRARPESPLEALPGHEARKVRAYTVVVAVGSAVALFTFAAFTIPIAVGTIAGGIRGAIAGASAGRPSQLIDGLVAAAYQIAFYGTFVAVWLRKRAGRPRSA